MNDDTLPGCHCCEGQQPRPAIYNAPGLPALAWRIDTQPGFNQRMLAELPLWRDPATGSAAPRPLAALTTREASDATLALVDAAACVADVLSFYQERIANEGFLRTATERRSVLELARAVGYELRPGVAAGVHLVFTVEDAPGAPGVCTIAAASPIQSVPPQGKLPQVFETTDELLARAEWNALRPRLTRPADMALLDISGGANPLVLRLVLLLPQGSVPANTDGLHQGLASGDLYRLDPGLPVDATVDALEVARVYLGADANTIQAGELLLFVGKNGGKLRQLVLRATEVKEEKALQRVRIALEPLPDPVQPAAPPQLQWYLPVGMLSVGKYAQAQVENVSFTSGNIATTFGGKAWQESELQAMLAIQGWSGQQLVQAISASLQPPAQPVAPEAGAFSFGARLGFFGHNAPQWNSLPASNTKGGAAYYPKNWDGTNPGIWTDSQGGTIAPHHAYLERPLPGLAPGGWMVFDAPGAKASTYVLYDAREAARADYGLSGRAMGLRIAGSDGKPLASAPTEGFTFRDTTAHVASRRQPLVELPIDAPVAAGSQHVELSAMVLGLARGRPLAFVGPRSDIPGVDAAEIVLLDDVVHANGRSTLVLKGNKGLQFSYLREGLRIHANVVAATHGESVQEVLGSGDASRPFQQFTLRRPPTTHLSAANSSGAQSTLALRVNGLLWNERPSLYGAGPDEHVFATRIDNEARMTLLFGDGRQGARLPTGQLNLRASYRTGMGADGEVAAGSLTMPRAMPLGLRGVSNPLPAGGAQDPEKLEDARRNAPLTLLTFERVVSLSDYQDFARAFPGIGKARADLVSVAGAPRVLVSVLGATGGAPGAELLDNLRQAITDQSDPSQHFALAAAALRHFRCTAALVIDPQYTADAVLADGSTRLLQAYGFEARDLAQPVTAAAVLALLQQVPGVVAVQLTVLQPYGAATGGDTAQQVLPAFGARWDAATGAMQPAELLLLNPAAVQLLEAKP
ncbi:putative baseplate assembly protein [Alicycliphilus denitrificans]|uniref:putative baseplate assembly protein n=1 Tax=Alicycliphilus denitrificans TaxID=179636 RepID=UPI003850F3AD